jgi:hypothetical protein
MTLGIFGCASAPRPLTALCSLLPETERPGVDPKKPAETPKDRHRIAKTNAVYAMLSNNVYQPAHSSRIPLPGGWEDLCDPDQRADGECTAYRGGAGFEAKTYLNYPATGSTNLPTEIVFAFRGTTSLSDWWCGNIFDCQYPRADTYVVDTLERIRTKYPSLFGQDRRPTVPVVATGHSLGGGLAQHIAYCFDDLRVAAVVFNTSPRSHQRDCQRRDHPEPSDEQIETVRTGRITRIHQHHEILSPVRALFSSPDYQDTRYYFSHGNWFSRHSITALSMGLTKLAACPIDVDGNRSDPDEGARNVYAKSCPDVPAYDRCALPSSPRQ